LEYQAKELLQKYGLRVQKGVVLNGAPDSAGETAGCAAATAAGDANIAAGDAARELVAAAGLRYPLVIKAQVPAGGRGKAGGVRFAENPRELAEAAGSMLFSDIKGYKASKLLLAEKAEFDAEWYLSVLLDRDARSPRAIFSAKGGVDVEETAAANPAAVASLPINPLIGVTDYAVRYLCSASGASPGCFEALKDVLGRLYRLFMDYSCLVVEINPLGVERGGGLLAADAKIEIDDAALYRLPDAAAYGDGACENPLIAEARAFGFTYVPLDKNGRIAALSNGSGMLMSMIDLLHENGAEAACALDLGGGAQRGRIAEAVRIAMSAPGVDTLFISIFGGITRCDEVAGGIKDAFDGPAAGKAAIVRMEGTNRDAGVKIVSAIPGAILVDGLLDGVKAAAGRRAL